MQRTKNRLVDIEVFIQHETPSAYLVTIDGDNNVWVPKSQCEFEVNNSKGSHDGVLTLPEWLAIDKKLV